MDRTETGYQKIDKALFLRGTGNYEDVDSLASASSLNKRHSIKNGLVEPYRSSLKI
jgi:hypothetical protein